MFDEGGPAPRLDPADPADILACLEGVAEQYKDDFPQLDPTERERCRTEHTVGALYWQHLDAFRRRQVARGELAAGTAAKERQCVRRYEAVDSDTSRMPQKWPPGTAWHGLPVAFVSAKWIESTLEAMLPGEAQARLHHSRKPLSPSSVDSTWKHLRTVFGMLTRMGAIDRVPTPIRLPAACDSIRDKPVDVYEADELEAWFQQLPSIELQAATALGLNGGPRTEDLLGLRWAGPEHGAFGLRLGRQEFQTDQGQVLVQHGECRYKAQKTKKVHWFPLPAWSAAWIERMLQSRPPLFPREPGSAVFAGLCDEVQQRQAVKEIKRAQKRSGVRVRLKPIQVLRATCSTRANDHRPQLGWELCHGPAADINSRNYDRNQRRIREGVLTLKQPPAFESIAQGG